MNEIKNQPEALRLAELIRFSGALPGSVSDTAASELRRLHAENQDLRTRHYCNTAEIESLQARVQELGEMARENRSKRVIELEKRVQELEALERQLCEQADVAANAYRELEAQLEAVGAGGVEPLRKRAAPAVAAVQEENHVDQLFDAVLHCPHSITHESVTLNFSTGQKEGHNALAQLRHRLAAYDLAARQRELQLLSEIEALERLALANLKQQDEIRAARKAAQVEVVELKERIARAGVEQRRAVREVVLEEREACAKACEQQRFGIDAFGSIDHHVRQAAEQCAAAIRARQ